MKSCLKLFYPTKSKTAEKLKKYFLRFFVHFDLVESNI